MELNTAILNSGILVFVLEKIIDFLKKAGVKKDFLTIISWVLAVIALGIYNSVNYQVSVWATLLQALIVGITTNKMHDLQQVIGMKK